jgi:hypothetical protein
MINSSAYWRTARHIEGFPFTLGLCVLQDLHNLAGESYAAIFFLDESILF